VGRHGADGAAENAHMHLGSRLNGIDYEALGSHFGMRAEQQAHASPAVPFATAPQSRLRFERTSPLVQPEYACWHLTLHSATVLPWLNVD
jgi:hypothetical protein